MRLDARYKVATSSYERLVVKGPLTDRAIARYQREGWYGRQAQARAQKKPTLKKLLESYK
jgi:hypothetical protein